MSVFFLLLRLLPGNCSPERENLVLSRENAKRSQIHGFLADIRFQVKGQLSQHFHLHFVLMIRGANLLGNQLEDVFRTPL